MSFAEPFWAEIARLDSYIVFLHDENQVLEETLTELQQRYKISDEECLAIKTPIEARLAAGNALLEERKAALRAGKRVVSCDTEELPHPPVDAKV